MVCRDAVDRGRLRVISCVAAGALGAVATAAVLNLVVWWFIWAVRERPVPPA